MAEWPLFPYLPNTGSATVLRNSGSASTQSRRKTARAESARSPPNATRRRSPYDRIRIADCAWLIRPNGARTSPPYTAAAESG